ncbi:glycosyltransferase [Nocardioides sp. W7]|uniref:glycosyltransferase family 2 protein n=1 Tax=Nocardioides sp. W7 TaxID=2931390 RepID=UPI001FD1C999|nr:glycosyltransferase [Nocardioides sp. W7]
MPEAVGAPLFSIVTPVYNPSLDVLQDTIDSVLAQTDPRWELVLVDDASPDEKVRHLLRRAAAADPRIQVVERTTNGHIVAASNDGIEAARGEFIALLDHDDQLTPHALEAMAEAIEEHPDADYLYSDEDKLADDGTFYDAFPKPDWSPERLRGQMYTGHLSVLRTSLVREVGGFHHGFDGSQDHDLALRVSERARNVVHVPEILYHWRAVVGSTAHQAEAKPYTWEAGVRAVQAHCDRVGIDATVEFGPWTGTYRLKRRLDPTRRVSVIIPTRGSEAIVWGERRCMVVEAVRSLLEYAGHDNLEIVVVHDVGTPDAVLDELAALAHDRLRLVRYTKAFNFSEKCNLGALAATGDLLLFLNDDVEVTSDDFVPALCAPLLEPGVGITGAKLFFADTSIQHAGLMLYGRHYRHAYSGYARTDPGPFTALSVNRECTGLTAACVALTREVFDEVGGFSEQLPNNFNDVDLSLKIGMRGYRRVWINDAQAFHFESQTREAVVSAAELHFMHRRWGNLPADPYLHRSSRTRS